MLGLRCWGQNTSRIQNKEVYATLCLHVIRIRKHAHRQDLAEYHTRSHPVQRGARCVRTHSNRSQVTRTAANVFKGVFYFRDDTRFGFVTPLCPSTTEGRDGFAYNFFGGEGFEELPLLWFPCCRPRPCSTSTTSSHHHDVLAATHTCRRPHSSSRTFAPLVRATLSVLTTFPILYAICMGNHRIIVGNVVACVFSGNPQATARI